MGLSISFGLTGLSSFTFILLQISLEYLLVDTMNVFFRKEALEYLKSCDTVIRKILKLLMGGLNVRDIDEEKEELLMGLKMSRPKSGPRLAPTLTLLCERTNQI